MNTGLLTLTPTVAMAPPRAAYVHVPFCRHRCGYCNFTVVAGRDDLVEAYLDALERELGALDRPREVDTLFVGGGTPSHLEPAALERLLTLITRWFPLSVGGEFSVEANPADVDRPRVELLVAHGVNRISLGAQSFDPEKLRRLQRDHRPEDVAGSVYLARSRGAAVSLDLIFAAPGETLDLWQRDLEAAIALEPEHLSTYGLTYERGASFYGRLLRGELARLSEDTERAMYELAIDRLAEAGLEHYEVSNFARPGRHCRHNHVYWAGESYYAAGPGAARYVEGRREVNHRSTTTWIGRVLAGQSPVAEAECLSPEDRAREALVLGLRRLAGVDREDFAARTGMELDELAGETRARYVRLGLLEDDGRRVRLSRRGLMVSDAMWPALLQR